MDRVPVRLGRDIEASINRALQGNEKDLMSLKVSLQQEKGNRALANRVTQLARRNINSSYAQWLLGITFLVRENNKYQLNKAKGLFERVIKGIPKTETKEKLQFIRHRAIVSYAYLSFQKLCPDIDTNKAFKLLKEAATSGCSAAQYKIGCMYFEGNYLKKNYKKASYWINKAAQQGHSHAILWYAKAAQKGDTKAQYELATLYLDKGSINFNSKKAVYWFGEAALKGNLSAQKILAEMYFKGEGVEQDYQQSTHWFQKSAQQGDLPSTYMLGIIYKKGLGCRRNYELAIHWLKIAAHRGHIKAQYKLGLLYKEGPSRLQNVKSSIYWLQRAARRGHTKSQYPLGIALYEQRNTTSYEKAYHWFNKASQRNDVRAQRMLGIMYDRGLGVVEDLSWSLSYYSDAIIGGNLEALQEVKFRLSKEEVITRPVIFSSYLNGFYALRQIAIALRNKTVLKQFDGKIEKEVIEELLSSLTIWAITTQNSIEPSNQRLLNQTEYLLRFIKDGFNFLETYTGATISAQGDILKAPHFDNQLLLHAIDDSIFDDLEALFGKIKFDESNYRQLFMLGRSLLDLEVDVKTETTLAYERRISFINKLWDKIPASSQWSFVVAAHRAEYQYFQSYSLSSNTLLLHDLKTFKKIAFDGVKELLKELIVEYNTRVQSGEKWCDEAQWGYTFALGLLKEHAPAELKGIFGKFTKEVKPLLAREALLSDELKKEYDFACRFLESYGGAQGRKKTFDFWLEKAKNKAGAVPEEELEAAKKEAYYRRYSKAGG